MAEQDPNEVIDATVLGPTAPSPSNGVEMEFSHIQKALPVPKLQQSETECLNLNITTPKDASVGSNLPVIVYLHGGGFSIGANSWPQYDARRFVELSVSVGQPIIGININYRLGVFGFLTSSEMISYGYKANNRLHDQRVALLWIKKHIPGFGGDPDNITLIGESAGGVSATHHLQSQLPLFKRMVSMSGTNLVIPPLPNEVAEATYKAIVDRLDLASLPASARVEALVQVSSQKLLQATSPSDALLPTVGGDMDIRHHKYAEIYQGTSSPLDLPGRKWCKAIMIGDCQMDASILSMLLKHSKVGIVSTFRELLTRSLVSTDRASQVLAAYDITEDISDDALKRILNFANDLCFFVPVLNYGHCWSGQAFLYHVNEPNSWEGPWKGYASHIIDVVYLFQNYNESLSESHRVVATQLAKDIIAFSNAHAPWPPFKWETGELYSRVYGGRRADNTGKIITVLAPDPRTERQGMILQLTQSIPADELSRAWGLFTAGH